MNAPKSPRSKITSLFSASGAGAQSPEEELMALLDTAENAPERQNLPDELRAALNDAEDMVALGKSLKAPTPSPSIRATVLQAAHAHQQTVPLPTQRRAVPTGLPGWRWAWAAIFLVCSWGVYLEVGPTTSATTEAVQIENELVQLETELQELYADLSWDVNGPDSIEGWS